MTASKSKKVFVGLSGGVDSSVAAHRLVNVGYDVTGVFIKVWHPDFLECNWEEERLDAMRVAAHLDIPFLTCDATEAYKEDVAGYFIHEYKEGRTPNPDVMCNKYVKFGAFLKFAKSNGADLIATGHYVRRREEGDGSSLLRGVDEEKDQSYFLWTLTQEQLQSSLFPVGDTPKSMIRLEAERAGLPTAVKKDSQGICFLGHIDIPEFLSHYVELEAGSVLDVSGNIIGSHRGSLVYTIGQRHGFEIETQETKTVPHYVISKDSDLNTISVSPEKPKVKVSSELMLKSTNWIQSAPKVGDIIELQTRYRQQPFRARVKDVDDTNLNLSTETETEAYAVGQSCVLYTSENPEVCLGGGILE